MTEPQPSLDPALDTTAPAATGLAPGAEPPPPTVWAAVKEAVRGAHRHDYTEGPIGRALLLLAVPMVLEVALESVFAVVNVFWVGRLGAAAVATVGLTEAMFSTIYALGMGLGIGATAMVARRIGEKNPDGAARAAVQAIALGVLVAIPIALLGGIFAPGLLRLMGAAPEVVATGHGFTRVMFSGNIVILLLFLINAIFRGAGDAAIAMRSLWIANICNLILDPLLIFGLGPFPKLGVMGAAFATTIGRGMGVVYQFHRLAAAGKRFTIQREHLRLEPGIQRTLLRLSGTGIFQILIGTTSWVGLVRVISTFGSQALAGYTVGMRIIIFAILPSWGMANAAATMVGQALGAKKPERAEESVWRAAFYNLCFLGAVGVLFLIFAPGMIALFTRDPVVAGYGVECLRIVSAGFLFYAYGMVLTSSFNGAGDTWTPTFLNLFCFWLWEIPLAWVLAKRVGLGPRGAFVAITVAFSTLAVASAVLFRRGRWKTRRV
ncbi:MAG TPA: MATE family efflux transporter [Gemmatimonadales bacterium]|nr:MATE family efflux transporter [Gemmatimonadales bacterium]